MINKLKITYYTNKYLAICQTIEYVRLSELVSNTTVVNTLYKRKAYYLLKLESLNK